MTSLSFQICIVLATAACSAVQGSILMTEEIWQNWEHLSLPEQLSYLIDDSELLTLKEEYDVLGQATLPDMLEAHGEFQHPSTTTAFFQACDRDGDGYITFQELCICRGDFDRFGVPNDTSEWAVRADATLGDFEDAMTRHGGWGDGSDGADGGDWDESRDEAGQSNADEDVGGEEVLIEQEPERAAPPSAQPAPKLTFTDIPPVGIPMKRNL